MEQLINLLSIILAFVFGLVLQRYVLPGCKLIQKFAKSFHGEKFKYFTAFITAAITILLFAIFYKMIAVNSTGLLNSFLMGLNLSIFAILALYFVIIPEKHFNTENIEEEIYE